MERRREPRVKSYQKVVVTALTQDGTCFEANVVELSSRGMRVRLDSAIPVNTPVKVEAAGQWMALGEVCYCQRDVWHFVVGLQIDQVLSGLQELRVLNQNLTRDYSAIT
jgi:hypothetical protein